MDDGFIKYVDDVMGKEEKTKYLSYLNFFSPAVATEFSLAFPEIPLFFWEPKEGQDVVNAIKFYSLYGVTKRDIFNNEKWKEVLDSLLDPNYKGIMKSLGQLRSCKNELLILRAGYRYGVPLVDDYSYDLILEWYTTSFPEISYLKKQSYDDDEYSMYLQEILKASRILPDNKMVANDEIKKSLDEEKSTSILPVTTPKEAYDFLMGDGFDKILFSLKIDGVNTKKGYKDGKFVAGLSRGRSSAGLDYTEALHKVVPATVPLNEGFISVTSEAYVDEDYLDTLRTLYIDKQFKTPKSSAISMLRNSSNYTAEDMKHLHVLSFDGDGIGSDKLEKYKTLQEFGFNVPPHIVVEKSNVPSDFNDFCDWLDKEILTKMKAEQIADNLPADGVVCEKIGLNTSIRKDQYSDSSIAIKFSHWSATNHRSIVRNIIVEQRRVNASVVLEIDPVVTEDGNVATRVNGASLALLIANGITVGSEIEFIRKSSAYNVLVV